MSIENKALRERGLLLREVVFDKAKGEIIFDLIPYQPAQAVKMIV